MRTEIIVCGLIAFLSFSILGSDQVTAGNLTVTANTKNCHCPGDNPNCKCSPNTIVKPKEYLGSTAQSKSSVTKKPISKDNE
jgi:hypothetical protein